MTRDTTRTGDAVGGAVSRSASVITAEAGGKAAGENFPVALRFLPARYRRHLTAVYGFARSADDMGDEAPMTERLALLDELEADLARLYRSGAGERNGLPAVAAEGNGLPAGAGEGNRQPAGAGERNGPPAGAGEGNRLPAGAGEANGPPGGAAAGPRLPVIRALAPAVSECGIPQQPFLDLIQANRQDQVVTRYPAFDDLLAYCRLSANPVGRIVLHVFGVSTPRREALSDLVCTALQLAEHWQDVAEDLRAGRIYLPQEDMERFGCGERYLAAAPAGPQVTRLIAFEVDRARAMLDQGAVIVGTLRGAARAAVAGYVAGGRAALAAITGSGHDVLTAAPRPKKSRVAAELVRAYATGR